MSRLPACASASTLSPRLPRVAGGFALAILLLAPASFAHHPDVEHWVDEARPRSLVGLEAVAARTLDSAVRSEVYSVSLWADYAPASWASFNLRLPYHLYANALGSAYGLGDVALGGKVALLRGQRLTVSGGLAFELPTGNVSLGLGGGHFKLVPSVSALQRFGAVSLHGSVGYSHGLGDAGAHSHYNFVNPHSDRELHFHAATTYRFSPAVQLNGVLAGFAPLDGSPAGATVAAEVGLAPVPSWQLRLSAQAPLAGARRADFRFTCAVQRHL